MHDTIMFLIKVLLWSTTNSKYKDKYNFKYSTCCTYLSIQIMKPSLMPIDYVYIWNAVIMIVIVITLQCNRNRLYE